MADHAASGDRLDKAQPSRLAFSHRAMTVGELRKALEGVPDDMPVRHGETPYSIGEDREAEWAGVIGEKTSEHPDLEPYFLLD